MRKKIFLAVLAVLLLTLLLAVSVGAEEEREPSPCLSPGLLVIAMRNELVVSSAPGGEACFTREDFERVAGVEIDSISITSRPDLSVAQLTVGSLIIPEGSSITGSSISRLALQITGVPEGGESAADEEGERCVSFRFRVNDAPYDYPCSVRVVDAEHKNTAPVLSPTSVSASAVRMPMSGVYGGVLSGSDADGDGVCFIIESTPKHGSVELVDRERGVYIYRPDEGYTGRDRFTYMLRDEYGSFALGVGEVNIKISRYSEVGFSDTDGILETAARTVSEYGIMSGTRVGESLCFYPDLGITREEFIVCAMMAAGIDASPEGEASITVFEDWSAVSPEAEEYLMTAYQMGMLCGLVEDGRHVLLPNEEISIGEAAIFTASILGLESELAVNAPSQSGASALGREELSALLASGIVVCSQESETVYASRSLSRGEAAQLLSSLIFLD